ncbi:metallophosphoesterase [Paenibacillus mucilaginosus]|uniref:Metallophosphoesterase n=2 Tax=Paenibacillus mucilaginosus TaxID=61624 RepID=H6NBJ5_9BACL|nr:metallophosphoesterase [Paenibacillus mucilaginosus]AEI46142.1 metallophosphoesterase [Paenibacillus mucilaginosus KNP414]AFC33764.1 metallophosphoesterase [Paenibacillus mucilaginosus 3016]MCG7213722.1 metallophosphoesterase [Paenibacillus mucilaginosus]WDM27474.1 metallophosphoesterase [Paenibacillus mucilaginosus]WFA22159.1 metallophosphoesterase [Paenibacillus mucilaginosus]
MDPNTPPQPSKKLTRRSFLKKAALTTAGALVAAPAAYSYARFAEPKWLDINEVTLTSARLPKGLDGLRLVQFSDVHLGFHYDAPALEQLAQTINGLNPEIVCFTGDLVDYAVGQAGGAYVKALSLIQASVGRYAVLGNHDYFNGPNAVEKVLNSAGFKTLRNAGVRVERGGGAMWIAGVEDQWHGKPNLEKAMNGAASEEFTLLLSHCPDFADEALKFPVDLQLSGHSHGGQVRLPLYGHVVTPKFAQKYVIGRYELGEGKLQLYVNRGIGVSQHQVRFLCRPELSVFTLRKA